MISACIAATEHQTWRGTGVEPVRTQTSISSDGIIPKKRDCDQTPNQPS